ncbi:MAG TPA: neutral zinc metallopeptidase [Kribbella sp.]|nr:neutral zinc metallopeptidase [Kribbella sp.]
MADNKSAPKPGHFLPGGAGDAAGVPGTTPRPATPSGGRQLSFGTARPVRQPVDPALVRPGRGKPALAGPAAAGERFGGPPPAPLPGAPATGTPLTARREAGGARSAGWQSSSTSRPGARYFAELPEGKPPRRFSKPAIAAFAALAVLTVSGVVAAGLKLVDSYDNLVENPLAAPSVRPSATAPPEPLPSPTVTVTVQPVPDAVRVKQNKLYAVGRLASVNCQEPAIKPSTKAAVLKYYQALLPCLNRAWAPLVRKAGYEFSAPKLVLFDKKVPSACEGDSNVAFYCGDDQTITMRWERDVQRYKQDELFGRVAMMDTIAHEYAHHVQELTHIMISSASREGWAKTEAAKLEETRRLELQASCLGAVFLGANKKSLALTGEKLDEWQYQVRHSGDEYNPKKVRDHGSRKNLWYWTGPAFESANPKSCNTYTAPAARVS